MSFLQPWMLWALPLIALPIIIHLLNQWRYQTKRWAAMMFLLAANRMNRGYAKLRQWLILAMRTLAVAGLIFAVSRPLASGFIGLAGGKTDTTLVLLDRSPSMQEQGAAGISKLDTGRQQLSGALRTLGSAKWVLIDNHKTEPQNYESLDGLVDSPSMRGYSATSDIPQMLQAVVDHLNTNKPGPTDVWICSDLRRADWQPDSSHWNVVRDALQSFPQSVRIHLLAYPNVASANLAIHVTEAHRESSTSGDHVSITLKVTQSAAENETLPKRTIPLVIEVDGARSELSVELTAREMEIRNHRVPITAQQQKGWGKVSLPADQNPADNDYYFVYNQASARRIVLVMEDRETTRALEIAASIAPDGTSSGNVEVLTADQVDSVALDDTALVIWQSSLPQATTSETLMEYVKRGGQVMFFPPSGLTSGTSDESGTFQGVRWSGWVAGPSENLSASAAGGDSPADSNKPTSSDVSGETSSPGVLVENWRGDQDLLAVTRSGGGLPVGQLEIHSYATLAGEVSHLATLSGGKPLLARVPTDKGGIYFCCVSADDQSSSLASNGIVLFAIVQRAIEQGLAALGNASLRYAGQIDEPTETWRLIASASGQDKPLSSQYGWTAGVYENDGHLLAVNRSLAEDQREIVDDKQLARLFAGLDFSRVDDAAGNLSGIVSEIWRFFLIAMIVALLAEAAMCTPRRSVQPASGRSQVSLP